MLNAVMVLARGWEWEVIPWVARITLCRKPLGPPEHRQVCLFITLNKLNLLT